jgi:hypothetical protein
VHNGQTRLDFPGGTFSFMRRLITIMKTLPIGTISHGTMRAEDLIPRFLDALESVKPLRAEEIREDNAETLARLGKENLSDDEIEAQDYLLFETIWESLSDQCPPYCYFGAHPGDGSDYGCWISQESIDDDVQDGELLKVSDTSEVPADYSGSVLHVNERGNTTLYSVENGKLTEVWAVV